LSATPFDADPLPHSGAGIASTIMAVVLGIAMFAILAYAGYVEIQTPGGINENSSAAMLIGLGMILGCGLLLVGAAIGAVGLFDKRRKKAFAIVGIVLNLSFVAGTIGLILIGLAMPA
jgi:hypothetical protein